MSAHLLAGARSARRHGQSEQGEQRLPAVTWRRPRTGEQVAAAAPPGGGESIGVSVPYSGVIACTDKAGTAITAATEVHRGDTVFCTLSGLRPGQRVSAIVAGRATPAKTAPAGADGVAALDITMPADGLADGPLKVSFVDPPTTFGSVEFTLVAADPDAGGAADPSQPGNGPGDGSGPGGGGAADGAGDNAADGAAGSNAGGTALTGLDVVGIGVGAAVLLGSGVVLTLLGRRRRAARVVA